MRAVGLICGLRRLKFVHLSGRKGVCDINALKFVILRVINALNLGNLALSAKGVVNSVCGGVWQGVLLGRCVAWQGVVNLATHNTAWRSEFDNETAKHSKIQQHSNKIQHNEFIKANTANGTHSTANSAWQVLVGEAGKAKMGQCLGGGLLSLSLSLSLLALFGTPLG